MERMGELTGGRRQVETDRPKAILLLSSHVWVKITRWKYFTRHSLRRKYMPHTRRSGRWVWVGCNHDKKKKKLLFISCVHTRHVNFIILNQTESNQSQSKSHVCHFLFVLPFLTSSSSLMFFFFSEEEGSRSCDHHVTILK